MTDELDLPKPEQQFTKERTERDASDEARLLASVGERLKPDGTHWRASFAIHLYEIPLANEFLYLIQTTDLRGVPEKIANDAVKEQARALALKYGHAPPKRTDDPGANL